MIIPLVVRAAGAVLVGLIEPLTRWVLDSALKQARAWQEQGIGLGVAVNLSASTLLDPQLPELVQGQLRRHRVPAARLRLSPVPTRTGEPPRPGSTCSASTGLRFQEGHFLPSGGSLP